MAYAMTSGGKSVSVREGGNFNINLGILDVSSVSMSYRVFTSDGTAISGVDSASAVTSGGASLAYFPPSNYWIPLRFSTVDNDAVDGDRYYNVNLILSGVQFDDGTSSRTISVRVRDDDTSQIGTDLDDRMEGGRGSDHFDGLAGDDYLNGAAGNDSLTGGLGNDTLQGGVGGDLLAGGKGSDVYYVDSQGDRVVENAREGFDEVRSSVSFKLPGGVENLTLLGASAVSGEGNGHANKIIGNAGENRLDGASGGDTLSGGEGADDLNGGKGHDRMSGGDGDDTYHVDSRFDTVREARDAGTDSVFSKISWTLSKNTENLTLTGHAKINGNGNVLANVLTGNDVRNVLDGGKGDDVLFGGKGTDRLIGGSGTDIFRFMHASDTATGKDRDRIADFQRHSDRIDLSNVDANENRGGNQKFDFIGDHGWSGHAGELAYRGSVLSGDTDGDKLPDFQIKFDNHAHIDATSLLL